MAKKQILKVIERAIKNPANYTEGDGKSQLRAAFDLLAVEEFASIFPDKDASILNMRRTLNARRKSQHKVAAWKRIKALREALKGSEGSLHSSDYSDHSAAIQIFIRGPLKAFYEVVK
jgi:hypothetical protein